MATFRFGGRGRRYGGGRAIGVGRVTAERVTDLLRTAATRWITARGVCRHWRNRRLVDRAFHEHFQRLRTAGFAIVAFGPELAQADDAEAETVVALAVDRLRRRRRVDLLSWYGEEFRPDLLVVDGDTFWARTGDDVLTNAGDPNHTHGGSEMIGLLQPSDVSVPFDVEATSSEEIVAGRSCLPATAHRRIPEPAASAATRDPFGMIAGGDLFRLSVDVDTGIILRAVKVVDGHPAEIREFTRLALDEPLPDDLFRPIDPGHGRLINTHTMKTRTKPPWRAPWH